MTYDGGDATRLYVAVLWLGVGDAGSRGDVIGETASAAVGREGDGELPTSLASAFARNVDTSFSESSVMVSLERFRVTLIVDPELVEMVDVFDGRLSFCDVGARPPIDSIVSLLGSFAGRGGGVDGSSGSAMCTTTGGVVGTRGSAALGLVGVVGTAGVEGVVSDFFIVRTAGA